MMGDYVDHLLQYETEGFNDPQDLYDFFQELIDNGIVWALQGSYGRTATTLINQGHCHLKVEI